ncbi:unnamed protein product [Blepharisma stoltei]|uniref:5-oxoprolinase n=1 Tax=Blepharisma stoltei TaxID=1481888 RepID=A0AAU9IY46_9CILI|nr:unnamed protein product [Blepharisma stoltei]
MAHSFRFSIDRGGTFTDIYCDYLSADGSRMCKIMKLLSVDPANYPDAPTEGIRRILQEITQIEYPKNIPVNTHLISSIRMGTTVATNALLERKGKQFALLITKGFKDLMIIGNQTRPHIFALNIQRGQKLFSEVIEVNERVQIVSNPQNAEIGTTGEYFNVITPLDTQQLTQDLENLKQKGIESIAICFAHSYAYRKHEIQAAEICRALGFSHISVSSEIMPMVKMYPRASTVCIDAYLTPIIKEYIQNFCNGFDAHLSEIPVLFMQSDGGLSSIENFLGSKAILSGPAGGVIGFSQTAASPLIGFDMGGTSTDVSRYAGHLEHLFETEISGVHLQGAHLDITTVAAGGGSKLFFRSGLYVVGPDSAGAHPGPLCYRKNGYATITDANLVLGRLIPKFFPEIFGPDQNLPIDYNAAREGLQQLTNEINAFQNSNLTCEEVALGFVKVANESMCRPIRALTQSRGYDPKKHTLACFGSAGGQHACAIARSLGITKIAVHKYSGILSAYGLSMADVVLEDQQPCALYLNEENIMLSIQKLNEMSLKIVDKFQQQGFVKPNIKIENFMHLRFVGTDTAISILYTEGLDLKQAFYEIYLREYGFVLGKRDIVIDILRVRGSATLDSIHEIEIPDRAEAEPIAVTNVWFETETGFENLPTKVYRLESLAHNQTINGPAIILNETSTIIIEYKCTATISPHGNVEIHVSSLNPSFSEIECDPILLSIFGHRFMSIAEQMGRVLQRTAVSTNIKERLDYSCAIFDPKGSLVANAPHLPVHLGSMQEAVKSQIKLLGDDWKEGQVIMSNHPSAGGTHLPDITVITPVYFKGEVVFYLASRGHHADIGGSTPGSMPPFSRYLTEEGVSIKSCKIVVDDEFQEATVRDLFRESRGLEDNVSDLKAQIAANNKGISLLNDLIEEYSLPVVQAYMLYIQQAASQSVKDLLSKVSETSVVLRSVDYMDDGSPISLVITIDKATMTAHFDFTGTGHQVLSNLNAPYCVCRSAVIYCLRCLVDTDIPLNQGCLDPITITIPPNSILYPSEDAAVVGGNVLTSQRITDVILKAFEACAASQGCMNNFTFGNSKFGYYETICGGSGAGFGWDGASGVQTHMTNTRITDVEIMERRYPVLIKQFSIRNGSGGAGKWRGGDGVVREFQFLEELQVSILSERRAMRPFGLKGGKDAQPGLNLLIRNDGVTINLGSKNTCKVNPGDIVRICTPGGGGFGEE